MNKFFPKSSDWKKWLILIAVIKAVLFAFFNYEFNKNGFHEIEGLFVHSGDTFSYLPPIRNFIDGDPLIACRMPGFLPIYGLFYWVFGDFVAKNLIVLIHLILDIVSVYVLGLISLKAFKEELIFKVVVLLYSISTFVSVYTQLGFAEGFGIPFLIFGVFYFQKFVQIQRIKYILLSGVFLGWAVFFRQIIIVVYVALFILLVIRLFNQFKSIKKLIFPTLVFIGVFGLAEIVWVTNNYKVEDKFILFTRPIHECYTGYPEHQFSMLELPISWGGDITKWGGEGEWFLNPRLDKSDFPFSNRVFTQAYNLDSLEQIRQMHFTAIETNDQKIRQELVGVIKSKSESYLKSYKSENLYSYFLVSRLKLFKKFLFPSRLDNLPLPARSEMTLFEFLFKSFYFLLLLSVNFLGLIGLIIVLARKELVLSISIISLLAGYMWLGWIEQRYFAPIYPFMVVFAGLTISIIINKYHHLKKGIA